MPKWLSSILIVVGFLALIILAILPRNIEVTVTTNVDDRDTTIMNAGDSLHAAPDETADGDEVED